MQGFIRFFSRLSLLASGLAVVACGSLDGTSDSFEATYANGQTAQVVMHQVSDPQTGMVASRVPLPSAWQISSQGWEIPGKAQLQEQQGGMIDTRQRRVSHIDQVIQQDVMPRMQQNGLQVGEVEELPQIAANDQRIYAQYWKVAPSQDQHAAKGIAFTDRKGGRGMVVVHFTYSRSQFGDMAFYYLHVLSAEAAIYEEAKQAVVFALANSQLDPQYLAAYNQREQQKAMASNQAHQQRMQANQQAFDAWNQTHRETSNAISDMSMESWRQRNASSDRMHEQTINTIWEREPTTNPYTGQQMHIQSGYNQYYVNPNGEYIGTNDPFYQPNNDPTLNNQQWQQVYPGGNGY